MNRTILSQIKHAIKRKLDIKAGQIIESRGTFLSKRDLTSLITFMNKNKSYSYGVIRYIYYTSPHRHEFNPIEEDVLLRDACDYPDIVELLWSDDRVVQAYRSIESAETPVCSNQDAYYATRYVLSCDSSRAKRCVLKIIKSSLMLNYALERAVDKNHTDIVKLLCDQPSYAAYLTHQGYRHAFKLASMKGATDMVRILLECRVSTYMDQDTLDSAMSNACDYGHLKIVELLLADGRANPANDLNLPIYVACTGMYSNASIARLLLADERVDPQNQPNSYHPITSAISFEIMRLLFEDGRYDPASCNKMMCNALSRCVGVDRIRIVQILLTDSRIARSDLSGTISYAVAYGHDDVASILVSAQADASRTDAEQKKY